MEGFNYPIRVLKRKMEKDDYVPFAVDCESGNQMKMKSTALPTFLYYFTSLLVTVTALVGLYLVVFNPMLETTIARVEADAVIDSLGGDDKAIIKKITANNTVVSRTSGNGTLQLSLTSPNIVEHRSTLKLIFGLSGLKEVYSDGNSIAVTIVSAEK